MYIEPTPVSGYVEATFTSHPSLMRYVTGWGDPSAFTRVGPNFTFFVAKKPVSQLLDCDIIPADKNNVLRTATAVDRGARTCLKPTEYNAWIRMKGAREAFLKAHADELNDKAEQALDVVLNASTNTLSLATDNVLTRKLLVKAMAMISKYGGSRNGMVLVTSNEDVVAELFDSGVLQVTPPMAQLGDLEDVVAYFGNVPIVISNNFTNSTATGGTAAYLWARGAITGGFDDLDSQIYNVKNPSTGTYDITSTIAYAFLETEQTGDKRLVRFVNP